MRFPAVKWTLFPIPQALVIFPTIAAQRLKPALTTHRINPGATEHPAHDVDAFQHVVFRNDSRLDAEAG